jgi:hypothetical protein
MAHFAKVVDGIVTKVIVAEQAHINTLPDKEKWIQTSYNTRGGKHYAPNSWDEDSGTPLRKNFAGIGFIYDQVKDAFYQPQPYPTWTLNNTSCLWEPPTAYPSDGKDYYWDESSQSWKEVEAIEPPES